MAIVSGFDYAYAGFEKNEKILRTKYQTTSLTDEDAVLYFIASERALIGVVSVELMGMIKYYDHEYYKKFIISDKFDAKYTRVFGLNRRGEISYKEWITLWNSVKHMKELKQIFSKYGLSFK